MSKAVFFVFYLETYDSKRRLQRDVEIQKSKPRILVVQASRAEFVITIYGIHQN